MTKSKKLNKKEKMEEKEKENAKTHSIPAEIKSFRLSLYNNLKGFLVCPYNEHWKLKLNLFIAHTDINNSLFEHAHR